MRVLIVDDEDNLRKTLVEFVGLEGWNADEASNGLSARKKLEQEHYDAVALDMRMPGMDGREVLDWLMNEGPAVPVVMMSAYGEVNDAVEAMKAGARDYLVKPFDPEELLLRLSRAAASRPAAKRYSGDSDVPEMSVDPAMKPVTNLLDRAAPSDATILITGESGTGKEVAARYVHSRSDRSEGPFVAVNLGGLPENLVESELFGYEKGAFTGADGRKIGLFESAAGGTLFLDEIGDMPIALQVKLLRALQEKKIQRLGGLGLIPINVRIVAATNHRLEEDVAAGLFREDLFYRINVIRAEMPPLRDRPADIPWLAGRFIRKYSGVRRSAVTGLSDAALDTLASYRFPGNIRELENILERAVILTEGPLLRPGDLGLEIPVNQGSGDLPPAGSLKDMEKFMIRRALQRNEGHRERSAEELGITRKTLLNKIRDYRITINDI